MKKLELICVVCPNGCPLSVREEDGGTTVEGAACKNGVEYGKTELTDPRRTLTTSVAVKGGTLPLVSVRSTAPVRRELQLPVTAALRQLSVDAPVRIGDVVYEDPGAGIALAATRNVEARREKRLDA